MPANAVYFVLLMAIVCAVHAEDRRHKLEIRSQTSEA